MALALSRLRWASPLSQAVQQLRSEILAASLPGTVELGPERQAVQTARGRGSWAAVQRQVDLASAWPKHPLEVEERLALAEVFATSSNSQRGNAFCSLFRSLLTSEQQLFGVRNDGSARCALILGKGAAEVAASEAVGALLRGFAVTLELPNAEDGPNNLNVDGFPPELLQLIEAAGPLSSMPAVHFLRFVGVANTTLVTPPWPMSDVGGWGEGAEGCPAVPLGMAGLEAMTLARTNLEVLSKLPRSKHHFTQEAYDLSALLSTSTPPSMEVPSLPGLPPPRWARSAYDRGLEEVHDFLDLLWGFSDAVDPAERLRPLRLGGASKHFLLTSSQLPEDVVKAAMITTLSPFREPVWLHVVALGPDALRRDPHKGFARLVESGKENLEWQLLEHDSAAAFLTWLRDSQHDAPPMVFGTIWGYEEELRQSVASVGGANWPELFAPEPWEQLRRWARPVFTGTMRRSDLPHPRIEGLNYPSLSE